jgi:hypothetical protein
VPLPALQRLPCAGPAHLSAQRLPHALASSTPRVVHLACGGCEMPLLRQLFAAPARGSRAKWRSVAVLVVDLQLGAAGASRSACEHGCAGSGVNASRSSSSSSSATASAGRGVDVPPIEGLDDVYNLLHQQLGMQGFMRQQLGGGALRLGWARAA